MIKEFKILGKHSVIYGIAGVLKKGVGFFMIPIYTYYLLPSDYGLLELLDLTLNITGMLVGVRLGAAVIRFYHKYETVDDRNEVFVTALATVSLVTIAALALLIPNASSIASHVTGDAANGKAFIIMFICLALQNVYLIGENWFLAEKKSVLYSTLSTITLVVTLSLNILFLVVYHLGVYGILYSMLIAKFLNFIIVGVLTLRNIKLRFSLRKLKEMLVYAMPLIPVSLGLFSMHFSDRFFIQRYVDMNEVGIYSLGYKFGMIISVLVAAPIFRIWNTQRFEIAKQSNAASVYARVFTWFVVALLVPALGISLFIDEAIYFMADNLYQGAAVIVPLIVISYVAYGISNFFTLGNMITGNTKVIALVQVSVAAINILLNIFLIPRFGIMGAAVSTLVSFACLALMNFLSSQREFAVRYEYGRLTTIFLLAFAIFVVSKIVSASFYILLLIKIFLFIAFPFLLLAVRFFAPEELVAGRALIRKIRQSVLSRTYSM